MKKFERLLNQSVFYNSVRYSPLSNFIVETITKKADANISFYKSFLPPVDARANVVFDIGANKGNKAYAFLKMGYKVVCMEPERKSLETLNYRFKNNPNVTIVNKGVSDAVRKIMLHIHDYRSGYNSFSNKWIGQLRQEGENRVGENIAVLESYEVETTTLDNLLKEYGTPVFAKIDVEGHELEVISGLSHTIPYISFEANLPEFLEESVKVIEHLSGVNKDYKYKASHIEQIIHQDWISKDEILNFLKTTDHNVVEIIAHA